MIPSAKRVIKDYSSISIYALVWWWWKYLKIEQTKLLRTKYWCFSAIWWGGWEKTAVQAVLLLDRFPEWHALVKAGTIPPTLADAYRNVGMCAGADSQVCTSEVLSRERGHDKKVLARLRATQVFLDSDVRSAELPLPPLVAPTGVT